MQLAFDQFEGRARIFAEAVDMLDAGGMRHLVEKLETRVVAVEDRRAIGLQPFENLCLALAISSRLRKKPRCAAAIMVTIATCASPFSPAPDLAGMVHADLEHGIVAIIRHARQCQRHAPMVVEGLRRGITLPTADSTWRSASLVVVLPAEPVSPR